MRRSTSFDKRPLQISDSFRAASFPEVASLVADGSPEAAPASEAVLLIIDDLSPVISDSPQSSAPEPNPSEVRVPVAGASISASALAVLRRLPSDSSFKSPLLMRPRADGSR